MDIFIYLIVVIEVKLIYCRVDPLKEQEATLVQHPKTPALY